MAKTLILYFSVYDSTRRLAEEIARQTGGDLLEIEPTGNSLRQKPRSL